MHGFRGSRRIGGGINPFATRTNFGVGKESELRAATRGGRPLRGWPILPSAAWPAGKRRANQARLSRKGALSFC